MNYAISVIALDNSNNISHFATTVKAENAYEAVGKRNRLGERYFKAFNPGYSVRGVAVTGFTDVDIFDDVEGDISFVVSGKSVPLPK